MRDAAQRSTTDPVLWACALIPAAGLFAFYSFVARARLALGVWPQPYRPDPKDLGFVLHHELVWLLLGAALLSPVALGLSLLLRRTALLRGRPVRRALSVFAVGYLLVCFALVKDPGAFLEWLAD